MDRFKIVFLTLDRRGAYLFFFLVELEEARLVSKPTVSSNT